MHAPERAHPFDVGEIVWRHGWNATAVQTLDPGYAYFTRGDGCVAYVEAGKSAWAAAGAPIVSEERLEELGEAFMEAARSAGKRCCFFATEERFVRQMSGRLESLVIGEQPVWDPARWEEKRLRSSNLREQLRRARAKGVHVRALQSEEERQSGLSALQALTSRWLGTKGMPPMGFLVRVFPASPHRRCFVAIHREEIVAFALVLPVPGRAGWFLESLVRDPSAPNGTTEVLVDAVMRWAAERGSRWLTLGFVPLAGEVSRSLRALRGPASLLYDFEGLHAFREKLLPDARHPISLSFPPEQAPWITLLDALGAFAPGGFLRFGLRTLSHRLLP